MALNNYSGNSSTPPPNGGSGASNNASSNGSSSFGSSHKPNNDIDPLEYLINYNEKFKHASPALFRDEVIKQTLSVLIGKFKTNALLIGPAGVGKTKIAEEIARMIAINDPFLPNQLKNYTIYELPLANIVAGSSYLGQLEEKAKAIVEFAKDPANKAILFIDEIHQMSGGSHVYEQLAQIFKPEMARGEIKIIGATTLQESNNLAKDPAFNRRFTKVIVDELTRDQTLHILKHIRPDLLKHYENKIQINDLVLEKTVHLADEYRNSGSHRPDNAITLLDRTMADTIINRKAMEQKALTDPAIQQMLQAMGATPIKEANLKTTAMKLMTGNSKKEELNEARLLSNLEKIKGQSNVIEQVLKRLKENELAIFPKEKPLTFLFAGSSGVGKSELSRIIAQEFTGVQPITLNMSEFHSSASINRIIGSPAGYVGFGSHSELPFDCLEANPYQIILLDEFEKCDKSVQRLFMGVFNDGELKTNSGKLIDFSRAIIIATTNAAHKSTKKNFGFIEDHTMESEEQKANDLKHWFDAELLGRFDEILYFNALTKEDYQAIIKTQYETEVRRIKHDQPRIKLTDTLTDAQIDQITKETFTPSFGARPALKAVKKAITDQLI